MSAADPAPRTSVARPDAGGPGTGRVHHVRSVRAGMATLAILDTIVGGWALLAPVSFHRDFPGGPFRWVAPFGEYSAHLVADVGGAYLMMALLLVLAARSADRGVVRICLSAVLLQSVLHLAWHVAHLHMLQNALDAVGLVVALTVAAILPAVLLVVAGPGPRTRRADRDTARPSPPAHPPRPVPPPGPPSS